MSSYMSLIASPMLIRTLSVSQDWGDLLTGAALDFSKGRWLDLDRGIVTSTPKVHSAVIQAIAEMAEEDQQKTS